MTLKIAIFNMKGGVGKSTTAYNLAVGLTKFHNLKGLLVDIDPQGNSSAALGIKIWELKAQLKDVLQHKKEMEDIIIKIDEKLHVAPSNILLAEEEIPIAGLPGRELLLRKAITPIEAQYDFVIVDCPPNIGVFSINALMACDCVLIPVDMSYLGLLGVSAIDRALNLIRTALDHPIKIAGVLATRFDARNNLSNEVLQSLKDSFSDKMCRTIIPETVKLREAPSYHQSIFDYDPKGKGSQSYKQLVEEVMTWL